MKKYFRLLIVLFAMILLSGCGKDIECKKTYNGKVKYKVKITADVIDGTVTNSKAVMKFNNSKDAKEMCNFNKLLSNDKVFITCTDRIVTINGYQYLEMNENTKKISKDKFKSNLKSQGFKC